MSEIENLEEVLKRLQNKLLEFPLGAVTFEDSLPIEKRITNTQEYIKRLNARLLMLKAYNVSGTVLITRLFYY